MAIQYFRQAYRFPFVQWDGSDEAKADIASFMDPLGPVTWYNPDTQQEETSDRYHYDDNGALIMWNPGDGIFHEVPLDAWVSTFLTPLSGSDFHDQVFPDPYDGA